MLFDWCGNASNYKLRQKKNKEINVFKKCIELIEQQEDDIRMIYSALSTYYLDELATINMAASQANMEFFFQPTMKWSKKCVASNECRQDALTHILALLKSYPSLDETNISLDVLESFYIDREAYHSNVMQVIENYLPTAYTSLSSDIRLTRG